MIWRLGLVAILGATIGGCEPAAAGAPSATKVGADAGAASGRGEGVRRPTAWRADRAWSAAERTAGAEARREAAVRGLFTAAGLSYPPRQLLLRAFKLEEQLEVWASDREAGPLRRVATYGICAASGQLGPKRREGDRQVPEGYYRVSFFHDRSRFHLALRVSYPNAVDRHHGHPTEPGGDIMIHGDCRSVGCLAMSDERIEEIWVMARASRGQVAVQIFPTRKMDELITNRPADRHRPFWENLREGFDLFEKSRRLPTVAAGEDGRYRFEPAE